MSHRLAVSLLVLAVTASGVARQGPDPLPPLLLKGVRVLDVVAGRYLPAGVVLVEGDRIALVQQEAPATLPAGTQVVEAGGLTLLPGLTDAHALASPGPEVDADYFYALGLAHGVTTYRVLDAPSPWGVRQRDRVQQGLVLAPRLWTSGPGLDEQSAFDFSVRAIDDAASARREAEAQQRAGVDWIMVHGRTRAELVRAIVESVPVAGARARRPPAPAPAARVAVAAGIVPMSVLATLGVHSIDGLGLPARTAAEYQTLLAGGACPESDAASALACTWDRMPAADIAGLVSQLARSRTFIVPLLASGLGVSQLGDPEKDPAFSSLPQPHRARLVASAGRQVEARMRDLRQRACASQGRLVVELVRAKVLVVTGTDWNGFGFTVPGAGIHRELALFVRAGLTPAEALRTATVNGAALVGAGATLGQIKVGFKADLVAVEGDPLARIEDVGRVKFVIRAGERLLPAQLLRQAARAVRGGQ